MKIKKFNAILATALLGGALLVSSSVCYVARSLWGLPGASTTAVVEVIKADVNAFSSEGRQVTEIPWRSSRGEMPGKATLKKWVVGDRTYYEASGPINPDFRDRRAQPSSWYNYFAFEVFFARGGDTYDQWIINPVNSFVWHAGDRCKYVGDDPLSASRYQTRLDGDRITITFWCNNNDTPRNIVFNYNKPSPLLPQGEWLSWVTTDLGRSHQPWWHHHPTEWTNP
jgi:hypothetical protein